MFTVPEEFRHRPFHRAEALASGIPRGVLQGPQFVRVHEAVYRFHHHEMTYDDRVLAASLALPAGARTTGATRIRQAGLGLADDTIHFVVQGDHHLDLDGVFLHRTVLMPPVDDTGATLESAFIAYCHRARVIDAIKVGCWLLHRELLDPDQLTLLVTGQPWRWGSREAAWILPHLDSRPRSMPEAELLALIRFADLPEPEVNRPIDIGAGEELTPDFWYAAWRSAVEYEGGQHQEDREQYTLDIDRYAVYRGLGADYVQVTREKMRHPRAVVGRIFRCLVEGGYQGSAPEFGPRWFSLFSDLSDVARPMRRRRAA